MKSNKPSDSKSSEQDGSKPWEFQVSNPLAFVLLALVALLSVWSSIRFYSPHAFDGGPQYQASLRESSDDPRATEAKLLP